MTDRQSHIEDLLDSREEISRSLEKIKTVLQIHFPNQYSDAYQHWIPQILTALYNDVKWLPRGETNFQDTIDRIKDSTENTGGVSKFIK
jgi:hypothetical protein